MCVLVLHAQNKPVLYGFDNVPQGLLLNPGQETTYKAHVGIPVLSGVHASGGITGFTVSDLFGVDGTGVVGNLNFNQKLDNILTQIDNKDYATANAQIEVASGGYKINSSDYLSVGFYTEFDAFVGFPKDLFLLARDGNQAYIGQTFFASDLRFKGDVLGVLHAGITRKYNERLTMGARFKIYSGALNVTSTGNRGTLVTNENPDGTYNIRLSNLDAAYTTSGFVDEEDNSTEVTSGQVIGNTIFSKNFGVGFDLGFTYHHNEQIEITGSILDIGFIRYAKDNYNYYLKGNYRFSGVDYVFGEDSEFFEEFGKDLEESVVFSKDRDAYVVARPIKLNGSFRYSFGKSRYHSTCHDIRMKDYFDNAVGLQVFSVFRPNGARMAFTGFYERRLADFLNTKVTWTVDDFSATNFGLGISAHVWKLNLYGGVNNIFGLNDLSTTHTATAQFGVNLLFN